jgi:hypothetical protein
MKAFTPLPPSLRFHGFTSPALSRSYCSAFTRLRPQLADDPAAKGRGLKLQAGRGPTLLVWCSRFILTRRQMFDDNITELRQHLELLTDR